MQYRPQHIINKNTLKIGVKDMDTAKKVNALARQMTQPMQETLEKVLDACDTGDTVRLDKIVIELNFSNIEDFRRNFTDKLRQQLIKTLAEQLKIPVAEVNSAINNTISQNAGQVAPVALEQAAVKDEHTQFLKKKNTPQNSVWDTFEYYLQNGHFPWWFIGTGRVFIEALQAVWPADITVIKNSKIARLLENPEKFQRFVQLIPGNKLSEWAVLLAGKEGKTLLSATIKITKTLQAYYSVSIYQVFGWIFYTAFNLVQKNSTAQSQNIVPLLKFWIQKMQVFTPPAGILSAALEHYSQSHEPVLSSSGTNTGRKLTQVLQQVVNTALEIQEKSVGAVSKRTRKKQAASLQPANEVKKQPGTDEEQPSPSPEKPAATHDVMIANAGLVIAWPFLGMAFKKLGWTEDNKFKDIHSRQQAVLFLHYLVYKAMPEDESPLYLNKLLCGVEPSEFISITQDIQPAWEEIRESLWKAIIQQWGALGSISVNGLLQTFIIRDGKVKKAPGGYHLLVERKTLDILLDRLPWPVSIIKPAWNNYIVTVTW